MSEITVVALLASCSLLLSHAGKVVSQYALEWSQNEFQQRLDGAAKQTRQQYELRMRNGGILPPSQHGTKAP